MEHFVQRVDATELPDPLFHGGDAVASLLITGETRKYNTAGGYFLAVSPRRTVRVVPFSRPLQVPGPWPSPGSAGHG